MAAAACQVRVRYAETDKMGVAYYANYFVWFEVGRCELLRTLGGSYSQLEETGLLLPVIDAQCNYQAPARYDDVLTIATTGTLKSRARVKFTYEVSRQPTNEVLASGITVHAATDPRGRPQRVPATLQALLA